MDLRRLKESQVVDWKYLPEIATLCQYLGRRNLKELSMTCKRYRNHNESRILENLNLTGNLGFCKSVTLNDSETFLDDMEEDLKDKYQLVKGITITDIYENMHFAKKVIGLFPHITKLKIENEYYSDENEMDILAVLKGMKHVEHVEFSIHDIYSTYFDTINDQIFSKSLKSLILNLDEDTQQILAIFDTIDSSYVNLTKITIVSNKMLANLTSNMSNLADVKLLNNGELDADLILEFLKKNPQLKHLDLYSIEYTQELFNTILSSNCLSDLIIGDSYMYGLEINSDFQLNYSIKKLEIYHAPCSLLSKLIKSCQNIELIELNNCHLKEHHRYIWNNFNRRIKSIKLNYCHFSDCDSHIQAIDKLNLFNQVIIVSYQSGGIVFQLSSLDKLSNYILLPIIIEEKYSGIIKINLKKIQNKWLI